MCDSELHYLSMYVRREKFKKRSQDQKLLAKGDTEGVTSHSQNNTHSFRPEPPLASPSTSGGRDMYWPHITEKQLLSNL